jgi:transposase
MEHCAIDLGGRKSQVCIRSSEGQILWEERCDTAALKERFQEWKPMRVVMETCAEAFGLADAALLVGHEVRVVPATLVKTLGVGSRRTKTDRRDAQVLSEVSCRIDLPGVHIPSQRSREWKTMCGVRDVMTGARTAWINNLRGWLRGQGLRIRGGVSETFAKRVREAVPTRPAYVESLLVLIEVLNERIKLQTNEIRQLAEADPVCRRLMTVPGVGPITAMRFVAAIDDISRFPTAHRVESYLGLVPGEASSSMHVQRLSITKAGPRALRWVLVQAAWSCRNARTKESLPLRLWAQQVEQRRGKRVATTALARKLAGILFALWSKDTTYDATRAVA